MRRNLLNRAAILLLSLLLASDATMTSASVDAGPALKSGVFDPPHLAPEFSLRGSDGAEVKLAHYRRKVGQMVFGYATWLEVCPMTLATLAQARSGLGHAADQ